MINVMVVDDHDLVRSGIARMLDDQEGIRVVGQACCGEDAVLMARSKTPEVVLMDVKMPGIGGLEATRRMLRHNPDIRVIAVTMCEDEPFPTRLLQAGAAGYLSKGAALDEMVLAVKTVCSGQRYISPEVAQSMALRPYTGGDPTPMETLSERELQIMLLIVNGHKVQDVADLLCVSPKTVNTYRYRIFEKLSVSSDLDMAMLAVRHGMVEVGETNTA